MARHASPGRRIQLPASFTNFPDGFVAPPILQISPRAAIRAILVAGRPPKAWKASDHAYQDALMRICTVRSAFDFSGPTLRASGHFMASPASEKRHKSFLLGNALCAHAAYQVLKAPWLMDFEDLPAEVGEVKRAEHTRQRPDYLCRGVGNDWYVLESKGRTSPPTQSNWKQWKNQASSVASIDASVPRYCIASAGFVRRSGEWALGWVDPPSEDGARFEIGPDLFLRLAYRQILALLDDERSSFVPRLGARMVPMEEAGVSVGLRREVIDALRSGDSAACFAFAREVYSQQDSGRETLGYALPELLQDTARRAHLLDGAPAAGEVPMDDDATLFADGIVVRTHLQSRAWALGGSPMLDGRRSERNTQDRVVALLRSLGYHHLGNWGSRAGNRGIESELLHTNLISRGYSPAHVAVALQKLETAADITGITPYQANLRTYQLLRYGVPVQLAAGQAHQTVHLIDWELPERNDFGIAEEVTLRGGHERRPDLVLYVNGLAVGVIELKRSSVEIGDGVRQLISNQEPIFNAGFFSSVQLLFAGSDAQGLRYGTTGTPEKFFVEWKDEQGRPLDAPGCLLDRPLAQLCAKERLLELIRNFVIFDAGQKKVPRPHQYAGVKAAQERIRRREGGVIWHTQGSGKSILMVLLAKWLLEFDAEARVLIVTDRDELDRQIEGVMRNSGVLGDSSPSPRITSRAELVAKLGAPLPRLLCALVHKFNPTDLQGEPPRLYGRFHVFVDECHRTQGGDMNRQMKRWLASALFIGFTGTPLLRRDKQTTHEVFGTYIHTYKFHQAVADKVVLDLKYEARDVPQRLTSKRKVDEWFEQKTRALNNFQKAVVRRRWATLEALMSAQERKQRIIASIIEDFSLKPRLNNDRGTAILVAASIHDACHYFRLFQNTQFGPFVGIITSFEPNHNAISREPANSDERYKYDTYTQHVLKGFRSTGEYEAEIKRRFIDEPANTKLLIVVSKLLTGFDAPSCTYIYLDNELRDHNLFQAICRTNRLDGDDKDYGHIVDFKELFGDVQQAIAVYSSDELDVDEGGDLNNVELKDWIREGRTQLDGAREALGHLCEPVSPPRDIEDYLRYFCGGGSAESLLETEPLRIAFYKSVAAFVRAYSEMSGEMAKAGYSELDAKTICGEAVHYSELRASLKRHSGEELDIKPFEADMRHLLNTYVQADSAEVMGDLSELSLTELIIQTGIHDAIARKLNQKGRLSRDAIAEGIINNVRKTIIREQLTDPRFYSEMSKLLEDLIQQSRVDAVAYEEFLRKAEAVVRRLADKDGNMEVPEILRGRPEAQVIYRNLSTILGLEEQSPRRAADERPAYGDLPGLASEIDRLMHERAPAGWRGDQTREAQVLNALFPLMDRNRDATRALFDLVKNLPGYR